MKKNKGFTLVELVIVIAVIAILSAVLIPVVGNALGKASESKARELANNAYNAYLLEKSEILEDDAVISVTYKDETYNYVVDNDSADDALSLSAEEFDFAEDYTEVTLTAGVDGATIYTKN